MLSDIDGCAAEWMAQKELNDGKKFEMNERYPVDTGTETNNPLGDVRTILVTEELRAEIDRIKKGQKA